MPTPLLERMSTARGTLRTVSVVTNVATELASPSNLRGSITFFGAAFDYTVGLSPSVTATKGIFIPAETTTPVVLTLQQHGDLVQQGFYAVAEADGEVTFAESIFQDG
jgi:hypothetical protein